MSADDVAIDALVRQRARRRIRERLRASEEAFTRTELDAAADLLYERYYGDEWTWEPDPDNHHGAVVVDDELRIAHRYALTERRRFLAGDRDGFEIEQWLGAEQAENLGDWR